MTDVGGVGGIPQQPSRSDLEKYREEYRHGLNLFQRALNEYGKADESHKKDAFREVMDHALKIVNETARELRRADPKWESLIKQNEQISSDYSNYQVDESESAKKKLADDLNRAKKTV